VREKIGLQGKRPSRRRIRAAQAKKRGRPKPAPSQCISFFGSATRRRLAGLDYSQIHPLAVNGLQLMHAAIISVEEVAAIRDRMVVRRADRATSPTPATRSSPAAAMFAGFFAEFDSIFDLILDTGQPGRH
jgi:hypothetical protein